MKKAMSTDQKQLLVSKGVYLHPLIAHDFELELYILSVQQKICLLPSVAFKFIEQRFEKLYD